MPINELDVFVNCPFDADYRPIFYAIVYTVVRSGYRARCALETDNSADVRLDKICSIIAECRFGIHDISRTESNGQPPLPRFNMPLELGLFLGARKYGNKQQKEKICIIFDTEQYRFQRFISDIAGQDIHAHGGEISILIRELSTWLRHQPGGISVGGGQSLIDEYEVFLSEFPQICERLKLKVEEMVFSDFNAIVSGYVTALPLPDTVDAATKASLREEEEIS
jgi:hypothetical protein